MKLIIEDDEGRKTVVPLVRDEISIGRQEGNTIRLTERNVSRKHAKLFRQSGTVYVEDLKSYNGVRVNGEKIAGRTAVKEGDLIEIGDYDLSLEGGPEASESTQPAGHVESPRDKTPPLGAQVPPAQPPVARGATVPAASIQPPAPPPPAAKPNAGATAVVRLTDLGMAAPAGDARDLGPGERPSLGVLGGNLRGTVFPLTKSVVKFGRTEEGNDLVIDHQSVSRQHGRFQLEGGTWKVYDNKSANGIRVNGEDYGMSPIKPGDVLELGHVKVRFCAPGERFVPPAEAPAVAVQQAPAAQQPARAGGGSKMPLIIGGAVGGVVLIAVVLVLVLSGKDTKTGTDEPAGGPAMCKKGQDAFVNENWADAVKFLGIAKQLNAVCQDLDTMYAKAKKELDAKTSLDEGDALLAEGKFRQAIQRFNEVPQDSAYAPTVKPKISQARLGYAKELGDDIQKALDRKAVGEAGGLIDELEKLEPDNPALKGFRSRVAEIKAASAAPKPPPPPQKSQAERDAEAKAKIQEANGLITSGDYKSAIDLLKAAQALQPSGMLQAASYRSLGVASARSGKMDDAAAAYRKYLQLNPNAPEKAQLEQMLQKYDASKGK